MLTSLQIRNIVLIEALDLDFRAGLGVLTGETGAGKSILLDALGLVLGNRAETSLVRSGEDKASVTATFEFAAMPPLLADALEDAGVEIEPGEPLLLRRQVKADGGSKAFVNGQPVGVAVLRSLAPALVELHGQHDDRGLVNPRGHRELLTRYAGMDESRVAEAWAAWRKAEDALAEAKRVAADAQAEEELLTAHVEELEKLAPVPGEEEELALARADMQKGERLADDLSDLGHVFAGSDGPLAQLRSAARKLDRIAEDHPALGEALAALDRALIEGGEAEEALNRANEALAFDPQVLDETERRLFDLRAAARKHDVEVDALPAKLDAMREALDAITHSGERIAALEREAFDAGAHYHAEAETLSAARVEAARRLDKAVAGELAPLKLDAAKLRTAVQRLPEERWGPHGMDGVEFLIATNPGAPYAPLTKIASGGELSRFILALKVALAEEGGAAVIIFDEIDRGVGGAVASAIGDRLARLANGSSAGGKGKAGGSAAGQLLAVTHSPQVAARGGSHYMIAKSSEGTVTRTSVRMLDAGQRIEEIARMLSGAEITPEARAQAERLLEGV